MFVSSGQIYVFLACVSFGVIFGVFFFLIREPVKKVKSKFIKNLVDFLLIALSSIFYVLFSLRLNFPSFRIYMPLGVFLGTYLYSISLKYYLQKIIKRYIIKGKTRKKTSDGNKV